MMGKRLMAVLMITLLGFLLGIGANFVYANAIPYIAEHFPQMLAMLGYSWLLWGLVGASIFVLVALLYAFFPEDNPHRVIVLTIIGLAVLDIVLVFLISAG